MNSEIRIEDLAITYGRAMGRPEAEDAIIEALKELSALRDAQERELREKVSDLERKLQKARLTIDELNERYIEDNI